MIKLCEGIALYSSVVFCTGKAQSRQAKVMLSAVGEGYAKYVMLWRSLVLSSCGIAVRSIILL